MSSTPQSMPAPNAPLRIPGAIAYLLGLAHAGLAGLHWTNHEVSPVTFAFALLGALLCFLIAYAIAGRKTIRDWNKVGFWFLVASFLILPALVHGVPMLGVHPR